MTSEEIKSRYSMKDIVERYGFLPDRVGFISCPFHKEKTASMKVYKDSYYCFGCGARGDIFSFVMGMECLSFREAFLSLGGTYEEDSFSGRLARYRFQKAQEMRRKQRAREHERRRLNNDLISIYRRWVEKSEPMSDAWCDCYNALQMELYRHEILNEPR